MSKRTTSFAASIPTLPSKPLTASVSVRHDFGKANTPDASKHGSEMVKNDAPKPVLKPNPAFAHEADQAAFTAKWNGERARADTLRDGAIKATIWERQGERGQFYATELARTYQDRDGNLHDSRSFSGTDLLKVSELAKTAYQRTQELKREKAQDRQPDQDREARREAHREARSAPAPIKHNRSTDRPR
ncbi:hypothetical protein [Maricaulis sp.]|uniref:hypothetical protein n=1 Tax=Maricaulis sp. TaxID=1486257 RepID=UPI0026284E75|nr:hypothetical protein [Maricaulis sp.]